MTSLPVIIIGVNPFALEVAHIFQQNNVVIYGFLDDDIKKKDTLIGEIPIHMLIATSAGVLVSVMLASALMGLVFLSAGSGHDETVKEFDALNDPE